MTMINPQIVVMVSIACFDAFTKACVFCQLLELVEADLRTKAWPLSSSRVVHVFRRRSITTNS